MRHGMHTTSASTYAPDEGELVPGEPLGRQLQVGWMPQTLDDRLSAYCRQTGRSRAAVVRIALGRFLESQEGRAG